MTVMRNPIRQVLLALVTGCMAVGLLSMVGFAQDIRLSVDGQVRNLDSQQKGGHPYYSLKTLGRYLGLDLKESGSLMRVGGLRGTLELNGGRPLVRSGGQYILLSREVWQKGRGDWYVPEDFLEKALPAILNRRLTRTGPGAFRVESVAENKVRVEVSENNEQTSVAFVSSLTAPITVRDFQDHIDVLFDEFLVRPQQIQLPASHELVKSISFISQESMGGFRLQKGSSFGSFRRMQTEDPPRLTLVITPLAPIVAELRPPDRPSAPPSPVDGSSRGPILTPSPGAQAVEPGSILIDPGHGGDDYGVVFVPAAVPGSEDPSQVGPVETEMVEKELALNVAWAIERRLQGEGIRCHLTRSRDVELSVDQRSSVANSYHAGAYIGIHAGATPVTGFRGPVVYVFGPADPKFQDSSVPSGEPGLVPWEDAQLAYLARSRQLAGAIARELNALYKVDNPVVEVPLAVLAPIAAPAVVVEAGILTDPEDRALLASQEFQEQVAAAIVNAVRTIPRVP